MHEMTIVRRKFVNICVERSAILKMTERRWSCVYSDERVGRENVCLVVLRIGAQLRESQTS